MLCFRAMSVVVQRRKLTTERGKKSEPMLYWKAQNAMRRNVGGKRNNLLRIPLHG